MAIYLSTVFSTFDMDNSGKIRRNHWKKPLKNNKITKLESDLLKTLKIHSSLKSQNFTDACTVGAQTCPPRDTTNVFKFSQLSGAISLLNQNVSRGNEGFSLTGLCKKLKNRGRVYSPWKGRAEVCALPATCVVNFHIFSLNWEVFWLSKKKLNQIWLLVSLKEQGLSPWSIVYCYQVSQWRCPVSEVSQVLEFLMTAITCILSFPEWARFVSMIDRVLLSGKSVAMPSFRSKSGTWVFFIWLLSHVYWYFLITTALKSFEGL